MRRFRWHGDPGEETQPDAGDVLTAVDPASGVYVGGAILRVISARGLIRGRNAGKPYELVLHVERTDVSAWSDRDAASFSFVWDRGDRP